MKAIDHIKQKVAFLKSQSGSHSPSIDTILKEIPEIKIEVDGCFLSNPYATDLFLEYLKNDLIVTGKLRDVLEYYPPQNYAVAGYISKAIGTPAKNIFVANGAIEAIQAVLHTYLAKKICVIIPTFSSYYEFIKPGQEVVYYTLSKENDFKIVQIVAMFVSIATFVLINVKIFDNKSGFESIAIVFGLGGVFTLFNGFLIG